MKAIIVPGVTDMNKGDQALVWESYRLAKDTQLFEDIKIVSNGDTPEEYASLCSQSIQKGFGLVDNILKHPRRGWHPDGNTTKESKRYFLYQAFNAFRDFVAGSLLLVVCNNILLTSILFSKKTSSTIRAFMAADVIFVKGGGFLHAYGEVTAPYLMWFFLFYIRLAKRLKKRVVILPNSYGPFLGLGVQWQLKAALSSLDLVFARESVSSDALGNLLHKEIEEFPDLGFFLMNPAVDLGSRYFHKYGIDDPSRTVGITIRPWRFPGADNADERYDAYIDSVIEVADYINKLGYQVVFFNQSIGPNKHEDDREAIKYLLGRCGDKSQKYVWVNEDMTCEELISCYSKLYAFIGTRFHSVIFSMSCSVPSIAIGYGGNKAKGIMGKFNMDELQVSINDVTGASLISRFDLLSGNYQDLVESLRKSAHAINVERTRLIDVLRKALDFKA